MEVDAKWAPLQEPFPLDQIGKLPKGGKELDFVGHAFVTKRLLAVDPEWSWEPMGLTPEGLPVLDDFGNLWIRLTILGVTRIGVGDGRSMKECIGDAIRNAAMRFGVALDLWARGDKEFGGQHDAPARDQVRRGPRKSPVEVALDELTDLCDSRGLDAVMVAQDYADGHPGKTLRSSTEAEIRAFIRLVRSGEPAPAALEPVRPVSVKELDAAENPEHPEVARAARLAEAKVRRDAQGVDAKGHKRPDEPTGERLAKVPDDDPWRVEPEVKA